MEGKNLTQQTAEKGQISQNSARIVAHLTVAERAALGKAARQECPRESHAGWNPPQDRPDPVALLEEQALTRVADLVPIRYGRMLVSPFAFYRGAAVIMASDLATLPNSGLQVQLCGDAHLSNFGGFASPERELILDINDFDETLPGPWEWDVKRLAASIEIACRERGFDDKTRQNLVLGAVGEYRKAMPKFAALGNLDMWYLHLDPKTIRKRWKLKKNDKAMKGLDANLAHAHNRDNVRAFEKLTHLVDGQRRITAHPPLIVPVEDLVSGPEHDHIDEILRQLIRRYRATLEPDRRQLLERYNYVHLARKVVGVGSVGTRAWIILMIGRDDGDPLFLQAKEAEASVLERHLSSSKFANHGQRVVHGQRMMQAASDIFLGWERVPVGTDGRAHDYYLRQLWDWKISLNIEIMTPEEIMIYGKICGWTLARAHARSGDSVAIAAYLGTNEAFEKSLVEFAAAYADQNERDFQALTEAAQSGRITVLSGI